MASKKLLTAGNTFKRTDGRWNGVVWYLNEQGERKRKSFSDAGKQAVKDKTTAYITILPQNKRFTLQSHCVIILIVNYL